MTSGRCCMVRSSASAGGQDEHPWLVKSSSTALGLALTSAATAGADAAARQRSERRTEFFMAPTLTGGPLQLPVTSMRGSRVKGPAPPPASGRGMKAWRLRRHQVPEHVGQDPAVLVVFELIEGIDADEHRHGFLAPITIDDVETDGLARFELG